MSEIKAKLLSRKFWVCIAVWLIAAGTGITGLATGNETLAITGGIMTVLGGATYQACEAAVDAANASSNTTATNTTNSVTVTGNTTGAKAMDAINGSKENA